MTKEQENAIRNAAETTYRDREFNGYYIHTSVSAAIVSAIKTYHELMIEEAKNTAEAFGDLDIEAIKNQAYNEGYKKALQDLKSEIKRTSKTLSKLIGGSV